MFTFLIMTTHTFVDFSECDTLPLNCNKNDAIVRQQYVKTFDDKTTLYYRACRHRKIDPIDSSQLDDDNAFKFKYMWNPLNGSIMTTETGELAEDPFGPLYLSPVNLVKTFYHNRLSNLWIEPSDEATGYFSGHYGDNVGIGDSFEIMGRGSYTERYLFRLPIPDCYCDRDHNKMIVTMGPKLTTTDLIVIDTLIKKYWMSDNDISRIYDRIGTLDRLRTIYEIAISKCPSQNPANAAIMDMSFTNDNINRHAVDMLVDMY